MRAYFIPLDSGGKVGKKEKTSAVDKRVEKSGVLPTRFSALGSRLLLNQTFTWVELFVFAIWEAIKDTFCWDSMKK